MTIAPDNINTPDEGAMDGNMQFGDFRKPERREVLSELAALKNEMNAAMSGRNALGFNRLCRKRKELLEKLAETRDGTKIPPEIVAGLASDSERWISAGRALLEAIRLEIERLQTRKTSSKQISNAYGRFPSSGRFYSNRG